MERILASKEAEEVIELLSENEKIEIERDKIRFGEYYIGMNGDKYYRLNPINIIINNGKPELINPTAITEI